MKITSWQHCFRQQPPCCYSIVSSKLYMNTKWCEITPVLALQSYTQQHAACLLSHWHWWDEQSHYWNLVSNDKTFLSTRGHLVSDMGKFEPSPVSWLCTYQIMEKRQQNILHLICQCSQQWCEFNVTLFRFQVAPVVLPMTTATTATVTATTTLLLHIQTMRWPALRYTHRCITYTHAMMALSHIHNMIVTWKRKSLVLKSKTTKHLRRLTVCFHCWN